MDLFTARSRVPGWKRLAVCAVLALSLVGCAGSQIRKDARERGSALTAPIPPAVALVEDTAGPYQMGLALSEQVLARMAHHALAPRMQGAPDIDGAPFVPYFVVEKTGVVVGGCAGCLTLTLDLEVGVRPRERDGLLGTLLSEVSDYARTEGQLTLDGRLSLDTSGETPALVIQGLRVQGLKLHGGVEGEVGFSKQLLQTGLRQAIDAALTDGATAPRMELPSAVNLGFDAPVGLTQLAVHSRPASKGSAGFVFIGLGTSLPVTGQISPEVGVAPPQGQWSLAVSASVVQAIGARRLAEQASAGTLIDIKKLAVDSDGLAVALRVWGTGRPAFWQDYGLTFDLPTPGQPADVLVSAGQGKGRKRRAPPPDMSEQVFQEVLAELTSLSALSLGWGRAMGVVTAQQEAVQTLPGQVLILGRARFEQRAP